ncbi:MAG: hypothetical protein QGF67_07895 [Lentisphaeria bacterium]|jgi:hypothetical protein|nr:hypothetical protein [Lentisphaeria bacterium]MDP7741345.1 hypothetical protein [Lentisphaeria bacterium]
MTFTTKLALVAFATFGLALGAHAFSINVNYTVQFNAANIYSTPGAIGLSNTTIDLNQGSHQLQPAWSALYANARIRFDIDANGDIQNIDPPIAAVGEGSNTLTVSPVVIATSSTGLPSPSHSINGFGLCGGHGSATWNLLPNDIGDGNHKGFFNAEISNAMQFFRFRIDDNGCVYDVEEECGRNDCPANTPGTISTDANGLITKTLDQGGSFSIQGCTPAQICELDNAALQADLDDSIADAAAAATAAAGDLTTCQTDAATAATAAANDLTACQTDLAASLANCLSCDQLETIVIDTACAILKLAPATSKAEFDTEVTAVANGILAAAVICDPGTSASCLSQILNNL